MNFETYDLHFSEFLFTFSFVSVGKKGKIDKLVAFSRIEYIVWDNIYNLSFGDWNSTTGEINDINISGNGDVEMVLATVARTVYEFTNKYSYAKVYFQGSTKSRTRLYQRAIAANIDELVVEPKL